MFPSPSEMGRKAKGEGRRQKAEGRRQKAEGKRQKARGKKAKGKRPRATKRKKQRGLDCTASGCIVMACELTVQA